MGTQPTVWDWLQLGVGLSLFVYALFVFTGDRVPALAAFSAVLRKASIKLFLIFVDVVGGWLLDFYGRLFRGAWGVLLHLWRGPAPAAERAPVSVISQARPSALMSRNFDDAPDQPADRGLSGLSADFEAPEEPDPAQAYIETLDTGSRQQAVAILLREGWGVGQIRKALVGDSGAIGREAAEARQRMGLADPAELPRQTPLAGRELGPGVEFPKQQQPAP
jgi:hypothetical protein